MLAGLGAMSVVADYVAFPVRFDASHVLRTALADLPDGWDARPPGGVSQGIGDRWLDTAASLALSVPSVVVPAESNFLLNAEHPSFGELEIGAPEPFRFDPRLLRG